MSNLDESRGDCIVPKPIVERCMAILRKCKFMVKNDKISIIGT